MMARKCEATKAAFEQHIREMRRPDIGSDADELTEADFVLDLAEDGWPDHSAWTDIWVRLHEGGELTPRERKQALAYWAAGEEYPPKKMRLCASTVRER
jgi:hypothetical protein